MSKKINTRIQLKNDVESNWNQAKNFIPLKGELIIYNKDETHNYVRTKTGDGETSVIDLPFNDGRSVAELQQSVVASTVIPNNSSKYAELNKVGGMTYKVEELVGGTVIAGPYTFSGSSITIPASDALASSFSYVIYLKNSGSSSIDVKLLLSTGAVLSTGITLPADGQFHAYTGDYSSDVSAGFILYVYGSDLLPSENVEASTITFYAPGAVPSSQTVLKSAAVTAIESASYNILDLTPALNNRLIDNGDGTYTLRKVNGERFSGFFPIYIPKGQQVFCYFEIVDTNIDGLTRIPLQLFGADKNDNGASIGIANGGQAYAPTADTFFAKAYLQNNDAEGAYVTFRNPMIKYGKSAEFSAYAKHTLPIPEAVKALDGYGLGVDATYYNYVDFENKQFVQKVGMVDMGDLTYNYRTSNGRNIFGTVSLRQTIRGFVAGDAPLPAIAVGYRAVRVNDTWVDGDMAYGSTTIGYTSIDFVNNAYTDAVSFKAAMKGRLLIYALANPVVTDISDIIGNDAIEVEAGGTLTFVNENNYDVPTTVTYYIADNTDAKYAGEFIGDLVGTASSAVCDSEGNNIAGTYVTKEYVDSKVNESSGTIVTTDGTALDTWDTNTKRNRITTGYRVYETDGNGNDSIGTWAQSSADGNTYVKRRPNGNIVTALVPVNNEDTTSKKYVDDLAATKVNKTNVKTQLYGTHTDGSPNTIEYSSAVKQYTVMYRYTNGRCKVGEPVTADDCATKNYVDNAVANKVSKTTSQNKLYATDDTGASTTIDYSYEAESNHIVKRGIYGNIKVADPVEETDAVNKNYVDNAVTNAGGSSSNAPYYNEPINIAIDMSTTSLPPILSYTDTTGSLQSGDSYYAQILPIAMEDTYWKIQISGVDGVSEISKDALTDYTGGYITFMITPLAADSGSNLLTICYNNTALKYYGGAARGGVYVTASMNGPYSVNYVGYRFVKS